MTSEPRLEIELTEEGVRAVRVFGDGWAMSQRALSLLNRVQTQVRALDAAAKGSASDFDMNLGGRAQ